MIWQAFIERNKGAYDQADNQHGKDVACIAAEDLDVLRMGTQPFHDDCPDLRFIALRQILADGGGQHAAGGFDNFRHLGQQGR